MDILKRWIGLNVLFMELEGINTSGGFIQKFVLESRNLDITSEAPELVSKGVHGWMLGLFWRTCDHFHWFVQ